MFQFSRKVNSNHGLSHHSMCNHHQTFFIDTFCVEVSIPGFPKKSTLFVSISGMRKMLKCCLIEFIKSTRKNNLNYRFPLRKSYFRVQNHKKNACGRQWHYTNSPKISPAAQVKTLPFCEVFWSGLEKWAFFIDTFLSKKSVDIEFGNRHFFVDSEII